MGIIKGEFSISKIINEYGQEDIELDIKILDHKLNSIIARYKYKGLPEFFKDFKNLVDDYLEISSNNDKNYRNE